MLLAYLCPYPFRIYIFQAPFRVIVQSEYAKESLLPCFLRKMKLKSPTSFARLRLTSNEKLISDNRDSVSLHWQTFNHTTINSLLRKKKKKNTTK